MKRKNSSVPGKKKIWILITAIAAAVLAAGGGIWYYLGHKGGEPVYVYPFSYVGMTEYWGDSQESYGPVSTDKIQTVFLSDTQTITEIAVKAGDRVKKGDLLMRFDTTLSDLKLERKRLEVEKLKLQLTDAQKRLAQINSMKPMVVPEGNEEEPEDDFMAGPLIDQVTQYEISQDSDYDGSTAEKALICWISDGRGIDGDLLELLRQTAVEYQSYNASHPEEEAPEASETPGWPGWQGWPGGGFWPSNSGSEEPASEEPSGDPEEPAPEVTVNEYHVVFRVTKGNRQYAEKTFWQGMVISGQGGAFRFRFEDAVVSDHMLDGYVNDSSAPEVDMGSGYTAAQIAQMRSDQQKKIKDLEFQIKMADAEYKIMQTEMNDGSIYAQIDGEVVSLLTEEEAKQTKQPVLKVSGGGGFYVEGSVSELEKDKMQIGQEVTVNDWNTGMTYMGTIRSVGDFPSSGSYGGNGNPNASYYPFTVFVDESADLQAGSYVSILYSSSESENGIYLENPFLRTEKGRSYVYILGENGKLEQRFVVTGKSLWGNYTEIREGLTAEDLIAFPYGKNVKAGVAAVEGDMSNLYG